MSFFDRFQPLTIGRAIRTAWPAPELILGPLQAGDVGLISGADGIGKSYVAACAALAVAHGRSDLFGGMWDVPNATAQVVYFAVEDRETDHGRRLQWLAQHARRFDGLHTEEEDDSVTLLPTQGVRVQLIERGEKPGQYVVTATGEEWAAMVKDYRLVIIDPLRAFHGLDESDGPGMDFLVRWLVSIAMKNQQAILGVHHASQSAILDRRDDHHAGRGATDLPAGCRGVWVVRGLNETELKRLGLGGGQGEDAQQERRLWRALVNGKASHGDEAGVRYLKKQEKGVLRVDALPGSSTGRQTPQTPDKNSYTRSKNGQSAALAGGDNDWE